MEKDQFAECCNKLKLSFNSLSEPQEIALVALLIEEESGIELNTAFDISRMLIKYVGSNNSALRQKINRIVFDKATPKGAKKDDSADVAKAMLEALSE